MMQAEFTPEPGSEAWEELGLTERPWYRKRRFFMPLGTAALFGALMVMVSGNEPPSSASTGGSVGISDLPTSEEAMSFDECTDRIRSMADEAGAAPDNIVDSRAMRIVRFPATDGSVLITCDGIGDKMIVTQSPNRG